MKKRIEFEATIRADREKVWDLMLAPETYREWTAEFADGSYYEGSWEQGEEIRFFDGEGNGMVSVIETNHPYEFISIRHVGVVKDGVVDTDSEAARQWIPAYENYSFSETGSGTRVKVEMDVTPDFEEMMMKTWPRALEHLRQICER